MNTNCQAPERYPQKESQIEHSGGSVTTSNSFQKGLATLTTPEEIAAIGSLNWNLLHEDLSLPAAVLVEPRIQHNLRWMSEFTKSYGVHLAPHGKTTMAPSLFKRQIESGAWGITLATAHQCAIAHAHGIRRILMANELVGRANRELISTILDRETSFYTLVDSPELVDQLGAFFQSKGQQLRVLIELGATGGRAGTRTPAETQAVVDALARWSGTLLLSGVEIYEGVLKDEPTIREFLTHTVETIHQFQEQQAFATDHRPILSGAGSAWYDVVAEIFAPLKSEVDIVLRPGCYITCDAGSYRTAQQQIGIRNPIAHAVDQHLGETLQSALEVWAYVQSIPEPTLAIVGLGKRDAAFDSGLPIPAQHFRPGAHKTPIPTPKEWTTTKLMDQHAYLEIPENADIKVGDMLAFEISHPCLTFDKWRYLTLVDAQYKILEAIPTFF
jgi:D-serine dehydratase